MRTTTAKCPQLRQPTVMKARPYRASSPCIRPGPAGCMAVSLHQEPDSGHRQEQTDDLEHTALHPNDNRVNAGHNEAQDLPQTLRPTPLLQSHPQPQVHVIQCCRNTVRQCALRETFRRLPRMSTELAGPNVFRCGSGPSLTFASCRFFQPMMRHNLAEVFRG